MVQGILTPPASPPSLLAGPIPPAELIPPAGPIPPAEPISPAGPIPPAEPIPPAGPIPPAELIPPALPSIFQAFNVTSNAASSMDKDKNQGGGGRVIILCVDGTGNKFGAESSNIVRFFRALAKDDRKKQIVYYQPGIGIYNKRTFITRTANTVSSVLDTAVDLHLGNLVKEGYQFIVQNYRPGDKICVFGFSRGAHTARVVAGMVHKVGILPKENIQQVDFAFKIYNTTGYRGYKLSQEFKRTFIPALTHKVAVDFVGVWDTVSSVGIIPKVHPYTSVNYAVKKFRHALSLDERRARFRPNVWSEITLAREHELDIDIPVPDTESNAHTGEINRDNFVYAPPERDFADVKEVWFAGTHADVGGGSHPATRSTSLSFIPLRWMIKECILSEIGIVFDLEYLRDDLNFDFNGLLEDIGNEPGKQNHIRQYKELDAYSNAQLEERNNDDAKKVATNGTTENNHHHELLIMGLGRHAHDIADKIFDQLVIFWYFWWMLEVIPMLYTYQNYDGNWVRRRMRNFGRGRYIPVYKNKVLVHNSVKKRIDKDNQSNDETGAKTSGLFHILKDRFRDRTKYTPRAYNWNYLQQQNVIKYVD